MEEEFKIPFYRRIIRTEKLWLRFGILFFLIVFVISIILEIVSIVRLGRVIDSFALLLLFYLSLFFAFLLVFGLLAFIFGAIVGLIVEWVKRRNVP